LFREIRNKRGFADNIEYYVPWEGYDSDGARSKSWVARNILQEDFPEELEAFDKTTRHPKRLRRV